MYRALCAHEEFEDAAEGVAHNIVAMSPANRYYAYSPQQPRKFTTHSPQNRRPRRRGRGGRISSLGSLFLHNTPPTFSTSPTRPARSAQRSPYSSLSMFSRGGGVRRGRRRGGALNATTHSPMPATNTTTHSVASTPTETSTHSSHSHSRCDSSKSNNSNTRPKAGASQTPPSRKRNHENSQGTSNSGTPTKRRRIADNTDEEDEDDDEDDEDDALHRPVIKASQDSTAVSLVSMTTTESCTPSTQPSQLTNTSQSQTQISVASIPSTLTYSPAATHTPSQQLSQPMDEATDDEEQLTQSMEEATDEEQQLSQQLQTVLSLSQQQTPPPPINSPHDSAASNDAVSADGHTDSDDEVGQLLRATTPGYVASASDGDNEQSADDDAQDDVFDIVDASHKASAIRHVLGIRYNIAKLIRDYAQDRSSTQQSDVVGEFFAFLRKVGVSQARAQQHWMDLHFAGVSVSTLFGDIQDDNHDEEEKGVLDGVETPGECVEEVEEDSGEDDDVFDIMDPSNTAKTDIQPKLRIRLSTASLIRDYVQNMSSSQRSNEVTEFLEFLTKFNITREHVRKHWMDFDFAGVSVSTLMSDDDDESSSSSESDISQSSDTTAAAVTSVSSQKMTVSKPRRRKKSNKREMDDTSSEEESTTESSAEDTTTDATSSQSTVSTQISDDAYKQPPPNTREDSDGDFELTAHYRRAFEKAKHGESYGAFFIKDGDVNGERIEQKRHDCGTRSYTCPHCKAMLWDAEPRSMCCGNGKVKLPPMPFLPPMLRELFEGQTPEGRRFRANINSFNNAFCMTSSGMNRHMPPGRGPPVFQIQGVPYHRHGALLPPSSNHRPNYAQVYLIDTAQATEARVNNPAMKNKYVKSRRGKKVLTKIGAWLKQHNAMVKQYKTALDQQSTQREDLCIIFEDSRPSDQHERRWNAPQSNGMCGLITGIDGVDWKERYRDIILRVRGSTKLRHIYETHPLYDRLQYVLLFPWGKWMGWNLWLKNTKNKRLTCLMFHRYIFVERKGESDHLFRAGLLFQKYMIDMYSKTLMQQLRWCRMNQKKLRAACYQEVVAEVQSDADGGTGLGRRIILPSSVKGGDRFMRELFHDFMAVVRKKKNPDLFVTVTCNPNWIEIKRELKEGQQPSDRPELLNRVFQTKLLALMNDLKSDAVLGEAVAWLYVIEWQKRGLTHAHILIFLHPDDKPTTAEQVDRIVSSEVPDPAINPRLYELVKKHMIHRPCDPSDPCFDIGETHSCCNRYNECKRRFPYRYQAETIVPENKFAQTKRTSKAAGGKVILWQKKNKTWCEIDARWIVKYNPFLLLKYDCHLNVEVSACLESVKYVCKYFTKGHDMSCFRLTNNSTDEIETFQNGRFVGACESHWNLAGMSRYVNNPSVMRLDLHIENMQSICHADTSDMTVEQVERFKRTKLTGYFEANADAAQHSKEPSVRTILYQDFPEYYTWKTTPRAWTRRPRVSSQIGRMRTCNFRDTERWCLRKLLLRISGATSYEHLRMVPKSEDINLMFEQDDYDDERSEFSDPEEQALLDECVQGMSDGEDVPFERPREMFARASHIEQKELSGGDEELELELDSDDDWQGEAPNEEDMGSQGAQQEEDGADEGYFNFEAANQRIQLPLLSELDADEYTIYDSFMDACGARGFLSSTMEWHLAMKEAKLYAFPNELRQLFCMILVNNEPRNSRKLWDTHKRCMYEDKLRDLKKLDKDADPEDLKPTAENQALLEIQRIFETHGKSMTDFDLPVPTPDEAYDMSISMDLRAEVHYKLHEQEAEYERAYALISNNAEQKRIFDELKQLIDTGNPEGKCFFVDGPGGTGKTTLFNALLCYVRSQPPDNGQRHIAVAVAASGIAALLLKGGRTVHNRFGLGIEVDETTTCTYSKGLRGVGCSRTQILRRAEIILWDEATMSSKHMANAIDTCLRDIMDDDRPFGGKLVVFGGDFRQTLCVVEHGNRASTVNMCLKSSDLWPYITPRTLKINMRVEMNQNAGNRERLRAWKDYLMQIGNGDQLEVPQAVSAALFAENTVPLPPNIVSKTKTVEQLIDEIYPNLNGEMETNSLDGTAILTAYNRDVDTLNEMALARVRGNEKFLYSEDSVVDDGDGCSEFYAEEYLHGVNLSGMPVHALKLKVGVPVMLLRNLAPSRGCCNGTRLRIDDIGKYVLKTTILTGECAGQVILIPRITLITKKGKFPFQLKRKQFPVRVAYAMTINKSQGQTLTNVGLYLPRAVFGHGQLYVALSRVGDPSYIKVLVKDTINQVNVQDKAYTQNVVYKEVL